MSQVLQNWEMVIGLEVHAQITTPTKLFSSSSTAFGAPANAQVSFVDAAFPGMLPVMHPFAVAQALRTGLGLGAKINLYSVFERKSYFYPDLPQGYQISQFRKPIVGEGSLVIDLSDGSQKTIGIERLHMEQDAGKSLHDQHPAYSYIDLNRSGVPLMEIVSRPDMRSAEEAAAFLRKLRALLRCLGTCDGNMEEGSMRADVNLSLRRPGDPLGTRTETKNLNSIRFVQQAIAYEAGRQAALLDRGEVILQETRLFHPQTGKGRAMRSKEEAHDYRYFPDPDLPPVVLDPAWVEELRADLPELPDAKRDRFVRSYGLPVADASILTSDGDVAAFFEEVVKGVSPDVSAVSASRWILGDYFALLNKSGLSFSAAPVGVEALCQLLRAIEGGDISGRTGKEVFVEMWETGFLADAIIEKRGLRQISDELVLGEVIAKIIAENPKQVEKYRGGEEKLLGWFVGQVMKATGGQANPALVNRLARKHLTQ